MEERLEKKPAHSSLDSKNIVNSSEKAVGSEKSVFGPGRLFPAALELESGFDVAPDQDLKPGRKAIARVEA